MELKDHKYLSEEFGEERFEDWNCDSHYAIFAETGSGKTSLMLNDFTSWTEKQVPMKSVLYCFNRKSMREQFAKRYTEKHKNLTICSYQGIEKHARGIGVQSFINSFDYIICDEAHYFLSDSFNEKTFLSFEAIANCKGTAIFITGTPYYFMEMANKLHKPLMTLREVDHSNNNVKTITVMKSKQVIQDMQLKALNKGSKVISFSNWINTLQRMEQAANGFRTALLMAEENKKAKYLMDWKVKNDIENSTDENGKDIANVFVDYLGCTSAYENGVNFNIEGSITVAFPTFINWTSLEQSRSRVRYFKNTSIDMLVRVPHGITLNNLEDKYKKEIKEIKEKQKEKPIKENMPFGYDIYNKYNDFVLAYKEIQLREVQKMKSVDDLIEYYVEKLQELYPNAEINVNNSNELIDIDSVIEEFIEDDEEINLINIEEKERFINAMNEVIKDKEHTGRKLKLNKISKKLIELNSAYRLIKSPKPVKIKNAEGKATTTTKWTLKKAV